MDLEDIDDVLVDFGTVYCGSKITKCVRIQNKSTIEQSFIVDKYSERPILDTGFTVKPERSPPIRPNEEFVFTVEFIPNTIDIRCCDSFLIKHLFGVQCLLTTKAVVKGPKCSLSCSQLRLICPNDKKKCSKQFDLKSDAECSVDFQFMVNELHPLISVQPRHGSLSSSKPAHITVTYSPINGQLYFKRIFCLISNHEPLVLDVHAMWLKSSENPKPKIERNGLPTYINGFHCFFYDEMYNMSKEETPLISIDKSYIDFGHCQPRKSKQIEFSVSNNCNHKLSVVWHQGVLTKEFRIQPIGTEIDANSCATFLATFQPLAKDRLYGTVLEGQVFSSDGLVPIPMEVNVKGNSFDDLSCGWAAQYRVEPSSVVLPPCVTFPFHPSHATLTIHRRGHLPLAYSFHPPPLTNFCLKPQHGLIQGSFQIVVVQYQPRRLYEAVDTEKWLLTFNSNENVNQCEIEIGCSIETPHMTVNHRKDLELPPVHPGTPYTLSMDLYNPTRFSFWYNSEVVGEDLGTVLTLPWAGELWPYQHSRVPLAFCPRGPGELVVLISFSPSLEDKMASRATSVQIKAKSCMTRLTVVPEKLLLKKVIRDFKHKREMEVTNSGDSIINASLSWEPDEGCNLDDVEITFVPETFYLKPGDSVNVEVIITPFTIGENNAFITYTTSSTCLTLLPVTIECIYPTLQITDLRVTNNTPLFTKAHYWRMMQINKFNSVMWNLRPQETPEVHMHLPSFVCTSRPLMIELLVENPSEIGTQLTICSVVSCDCKPVKRQTNISISKWDHNCPHKHQVELEPTSVYIQAGSHIILKMNIFYKTIGDVETHFLLQFTAEDYEDLSCSMKLLVSRTSIEKLTPYVNTTEPKENGDFVFNMKSVYIGDINAFAQGFLLYNSTKLNIDFEVDDAQLKGTPFKYIGEKDQILSLSNHHLLFTFLPYCCETYEAEVTITINDEHKKLILRGSGVSNPQAVNTNEECFPTKDKLNEINPRGVYFSTSHTNIGPIKPKSTMKDVFIINNNTKDIVSFMFLSTKHAELVQLRVTPCKGLMQPGECVECHLKCQSCGWPSYLEVTLACAHASFSQYVANIQTLNQYYEDLVMSQNYFTITQEGSCSVSVTPPIESWPVKNYLTIGVTVDVKDQPVKLDKGLLSVCPAVIESDQYDVFEIPNENKFIYIDVLERLLSQVINNEMFQSRNDSVNMYYEQIKDLDRQIAVQVPNHVAQTVLEDILHATWQDVFQLHGNRSCELLRRNLIHQALPVKYRYSSSGIPKVDSISMSFNSIGSERSRFSS